MEKYNITYFAKGMTQNIEIEDCNNILDAIAKFTKGGYNCIEEIRVISKDGNDQ